MNHDNTKQLRCIRHLAKASRISREAAAQRWVQTGCAAKWRAAQKRSRA